MAHAEHRPPDKDELAEERAILTEVAASTPAAIALLWTPRYRIRFVNQQWLDTFPFPAPVLGRTIDEVLPNAASILIPLLDRVCRTGDAFTGIDVPVPSDGATALAGYRYFTLILRLISAPSGGTGGVLVVCTETTQEVRRRSQIERELTTERGIADALQRSLLPPAFAAVPGVAVAVRYVPASADAEVGGDWYDVIPLEGDRVGICIGDVVGHGIQAAGTMAQVRDALRAFVSEGHPPAAIVQRLDRLLARENRMATMIYAAFEVGTSRLVVVNAGHPPALVVSADGVTTYLQGRRHVPVGAGLTTPFEEAVVTLAPQSTLVLYTDGLIGGHASSIQQGLDRLPTMAAEAQLDPEDLCDHLLATMQPGELGHDDIALLALRVTPLPLDHFQLELLAETNVLACLRSTLGTWLRHSGATRAEVAEIVTACTEACMNVVEHAYTLGPKVLEVEGSTREHEITVVVRDQGMWRPVRTEDPGYGQTLMRALTDELSTESTAHGTTVRMRRRLRSADP